MTVNSQNDLKILILSAPIGSGHRLAAEALKEYLESIPGVEVEHGNVFNFFPAILGKLFLATYLKILAWCPWMYELAYKWGNRGGGSLWLRSLINRILAWLGESYILRQKPAAVIATHATPAGIMSYIKQKHPMWLGCVITDYTVHRWWLVEGADAYFVAAPELKDRLPGVKEVLSLGIPLRKAFAELEPLKAKQQLGWQNSGKTCLLLGGGEGLLPMEEIIDSLRQFWPEELRLVAVTGHNFGLKARLEANYSSLIENDCLQVLGFSQELPQLMAASDLVVTKAGGLSTAELLASGVSFIIYKPLPGQEENNAAFLKAHYGVGTASNQEELLQLLKEQLKRPKDRKNYYGKPLAAQEIGNYILRQLNCNKMS